MLLDYLNPTSFGSNSMIPSACVPVVVDTPDSGLGNDYAHDDAEVVSALTVMGDLRHACVCALQEGHDGQRSKSIENEYARYQYRNLFGCAARMNDQTQYMPDHGRGSQEPTCLVYRRILQEGWYDRAKRGYGLPVWAIGIGMKGWTGWTGLGSMASVGQGEYWVTTGAGDGGVRIDVGACDWCL